MDHSSHKKIVSFIWSIADDCLRNVFVRSKYRDVILPMFVLRRINCLLEESKEEVLPHVPDAWISEDSTKVGYEIPFNKYFYVHQPLRQLDEVISEIRPLEQETEGLLEEILNF